MNFPILPEPIQEITFADLFAKGRISRILFNKLTFYAHLSTISDLYQEYGSADDFVSRVNTAGKRVGTEINDLLIELSSGDSSEGNSPQNLLLEISSITDPMPVFADDVADITFDSLREKKLISLLLHNKLVRDAKLHCVGDLNGKYTSVTAFVTSIRGAGVGSQNEIRKFIEDIATDPAPYVKAHQFFLGTYLPHQVDLTESLAQTLTQLLTDFTLELKNRDRKNKRSFGPVAEHIFLKGRTLEDTSALMDITRERVRQIKLQLVNGFQAWFKTSQNPNLPHFLIRQELRETVNTLISDLRQAFPTLAEQQELTNWLAARAVHFGSYTNIAWLFFCYLADIQPAGKVESNFTKANFFITDPAFEKDLFFTIARLTLNTLKDVVTPLQKEELIIAVNQRLKKEAPTQQKELRKALRQMVDLSVSCLPEIETLQRDSEVSYQVHFHYLSSQSDLAERVLFEAGRVMPLDEIAAEIRKRLQQAGSDRDFDVNILRALMVSQKKTIVHHGKNSLYHWEDPKSNAPVKGYSKTDLVLKALKEANQPLSFSSIDAYINAHLAKIGVDLSNEPKTASGILSYLTKQKNGICRLTDGSYILRAWENDAAYSGNKESQKALKGSLQPKIEQLIDASPDKIIRLNTLVNKLAAEGHSKGNIYALLLKRVEVFEQFEQNDKKYIRLLPTSSAPVKVHKQVQIRDRIVTLLSSVPGKRLALKVIVNQLVAEFSLSASTRPLVYKVVAINPTLFFKEEKEETYITLLTTPDQPTIAEAFEPGKHWDTLKAVLISETGATLTLINKRPPTQVLDLFSQVAQRSSSHEDLEGLRHLLDYIWNYYTVEVSDQQKYLYARAIITLMEPYLLKILSFVNTYYYDEYQADEKKGLAMLVKKLHRANPWKQPETKAIYDLAKSARNKAAHSARVWDVAKERERVNACLIEMLFVVDCYYADLLSKPVQAQ
ncbi:hypothetical protein JYG30_06175 [Fibrella sp. USSR17]